MKIYLTLPATFFAGLLIVGPSVMAQPSSAPKGEVLEFGIYQSVTDKTTAANPDTPNGTRTTAKKVEFTEHTDKIPGTKGTSFGIRYKITGLSEQDSVSLKKVVKHPPFKNRKGEMESEYSLELKPKVKDGTVISVEGYGLGGSNDTTPGAWTFEIWYHDQKLASQSFTVVSPSAPKKK